jgi:hypothetical protein
MRRSILWSGYLQKRTFLMAADLPVKEISDIWSNRYGYMEPG